jgi:hypothetical protein
MKRAIAIAVMFAFGTTQAVAATCNGFTALSYENLVQALSNKYACTGKYPNATWNELHIDSLGSGPTLAGKGNIQDFKKGNDPVDPTQIIGTYAINALIPPTIKYDYGGGTTYTYIVAASATTTAPNPGTYYFCDTGSSTILTLSVQSSNC